jgi:hypothetical protein
MAELQRRTRDLMTRLTNNEEALQDGLKEIERKLTGLSERLDAMTAGLERQARRVAIGGIRLEAAGLVLVAVGTVLQSL